MIEVEIAGKLDSAPPPSSWPADEIITSRVNAPGVSAVLAGSLAIPTLCLGSGCGLRFGYRSCRNRFGCPFGLETASWAADPLAMVG